LPHVEAEEVINKVEEHASRFCIPAHIKQANFDRRKEEDKK